MSAGEMPSRPLSVAIPGSSGPYCPRRPTLQEVLTNKAPSPWTLSAFMAYLSQNHCLETLEFTMDAQRYKTYYQSLSQRDPTTPISPSTPDYEYMRMLWQKLLDAYIAPNGPREINLPSNVRDRLLSLPCTEMPPDAAELEPAVKIIYELMDESVLVPFVHSFAPAQVTDPFMGISASIEPVSSPPLSGQKSDIVSQSFGGASPKFSQQSHMTAALHRARSSGISSFLAGGGSATSSSAEQELFDSMTDDSTDSASPSLSALEPMTPPDTPPTSNAEFGIALPSLNPPTLRQKSSSSWKRMGDKLGWKKSSRPSSSTSSTSGSRYPMERGSIEDGSVL